MSVEARLVKQSHGVNLRWLPGPGIQYEVLVDGYVWFSSGPFWVEANNRTHDDLKVMFKNINNL